MRSYINHEITKRQKRKSQKRKFRVFVVKVDLSTNIRYWDFPENMGSVKCQPLSAFPYKKRLPITAS